MTGPNLYTASAALVRLARALEDAVNNKTAVEIGRLAEECREVATDIDRAVTSRRMRGTL